MKNTDINLNRVSVSVFKLKIKDKKDSQQDSAENNKEGKNNENKDVN